MGVQGTCPVRGEKKIVTDRSMSPFLITVTASQMIIELLRLPKLQGLPLSVHTREHHLVLLISVLHFTHQWPYQSPQVL